MIIDATTTKKVGLAICMNSLCTLSFLGMGLRTMGDDKKSHE